MPAFDTYLFFQGQCAEALRFYERTLGGKIEALFTYADAPGPTPCAAGTENLVMHARLVIDGRTLMASDTPPGMGGNPAGAFSLSLQYPTADEGRRVFDALSQGGTVTMPIQQTFYADAHGMFTDRFGIPWMVGGGFHDPK